ncbi:MAG: hypothetical protein FJ293_08055 [Planctomycetes bacterium]|nr:hypothetical protein [Planctomycetota bacterium]
MPTRPVPNRRRAGGERRPAAKKSQLPLIAGIGGAVVVIVVAAIALGGGDGGGGGAGAGTTAPGGGGAAAVNPTPAAIETATPVAAKPIEPPKVVEPPLPNAAALKKKIKTAASATEAAALARDADRLKDAQLSEECWTRVFELDSDHAEARKKLDVRQLVPSDDLPGFAALAATPMQLHLKEFYDAARDELPRAGRAEIVKRWEEARTALEARAAKAKDNPYYRAVDLLRNELQSSDFFAALQYEMVESCPPYALLVEVGGTPEERAARRNAVEDGYTPYLRAYDARIRSYLFPLSPNPPKQDPLLPVFIFLNEERYRDYQEAELGSRGKGSTRAHYEPGKKKSFTWTTVVKPGLGAFEESVQVLLHELTHAWVDQLASSDGGDSRSIRTLKTHWFSEGIAEYMRFQFREKIGGDISYRYQPWRSSRLGETGRSAKLRLGLKAAIELPPHGLDAAAARMTIDTPPAQREGVMGTITSGFYADMSNFILWLNFPAPHGAGMPEQFRQYARAEMSGEGGDATFRRIFPGLLEQGEALDQKVDAFVLAIASGKMNPYKELANAGIKEF